MRRLLFGLLGLLLIASCGGGGGESISGDDVEVDMFDDRFEFTEIRILRRI